MKNEIWKDIEGFEGLYVISNQGEVKSLSRQRKGRYGNDCNVMERLLKKGNDKRGYFKVPLSKKGKVEIHKVHRLVANAFIPKIQGKKFVNHKDGNKQNNLVDNLEWVTSSENIIHSFENGMSVRGELHPHSKLTRDGVVEIKTLLSKGVSQKDIAEKFGVLPTAISKIKRGLRWKHVQI